MMLGHMFAGLVTQCEIDTGLLSLSVYLARHFNLPMFPTPLVPEDWTRPISSPSIPSKLPRIFDDFDSLTQTSVHVYTLPADLDQTRIPPSGPIAVATLTLDHEPGTQAMPKDQSVGDKPRVKAEECTIGVVSAQREIASGWQCFMDTYAMNATNANGSIDRGDFDMEYKHTLCTTSTVRLHGSDLLPDTIITTDAELKRIQQITPLPSTSTPQTYNLLRWGFFSVYRKMFAFVLSVNLTAMVAFFYQLKSNESIVNYGNAATAASANFCVSILIRNEHIINLGFRCVCCLPVSAPLGIRRRAAKVYSHGGIHSGCGVSGTFWYIAFTVLIMIQYRQDGLVGPALAVTTAFALFLLIIILAFAHPKLRTRMHNHFEASHRYGGWLAIFVLWAQTLILVFSKGQQEKQAYGTVVIHTPPFWFLLVITMLLVYPWTQLRSRQCQVEQLSSHATRLYFNHANVSSCVAVRLTDAPLCETHAFATIPNYSDQEKGFSVLISNAGDWTNKIISNPPSHIYIKGVPTMGVMRVALIFKKVLVIATGSGIGPCMSMLQAYPDYPMRVLWSTKDPEATYGSRILQSVFRADPNAVIIDTQKNGRPDIVALAYALFVQSECEAAIVVSNPALTRKLVFGLESRGVPAYGPVFDS
ncbi:hypothetical protein K461DRAFT_278183 [Myriangium duriaei CBS 260.36]|uniref:Integral membrane protein TmpA n=1 Tax=Myriangium duriaei CBS 260.36 TaxID=1168546 RepID=A0A9P4J284_9PEZI|nr:hypothetical protein K461DRAFT_278183 [Myriangium duriaei CBS 260.36]